MGFHEVATRSERHDWETPDDLFAHCRSLYRFDFDAAAHSANAKMPVYISPLADALAVNWGEYGKRAWLNPPYGRALRPFIERVVAALRDGEIDLCVALVPARTDTRWFARAVATATEIWFLRGRVRFVGSASAAPFPSALFVWDRGGRRYGAPVPNAYSIG